MLKHISLGLIALTSLSLNAYADGHQLAGTYKGPSGTVTISDVAPGKSFKYAIKLTAPAACEGTALDGTASFTKGDANRASDDTRSFSFKGAQLLANLSDMEIGSECESDFDRNFTKVTGGAATSPKGCPEGREGAACREKALESDTCAALLGTKNPKSLLKRYGKPSVKKHSVMGGDDDQDYEQWSWWKKHGVKVTIWVDENIFTYCAVKGSFKGKTARGIHIGSTVDEVTKAYADVKESGSVKSKWITFGSPYNPIKFKHKGKKVTLMRIGANLDAFKGKKGK